MGQFKIGDAVGFKSGHEQYGTVVGLKRGFMNSRILVIKVYDSNTGSHYEVEQSARDCWLNE